MGGERVGCGKVPSGASGRCARGASDRIAVRRRGGLSLQQGLDAVANLLVRRGQHAAQRGESPTPCANWPPAGKFHAWLHYPQVLSALLVEALEHLGPAPLADLLQ